MIIYFVLIAKQLTLCGQHKENLHTDKLVEAKRVKAKILLGLKQLKLFFIVTLFAFVG